MSLFFLFCVIGTIGLSTPYFSHHHYFLHLSVRLQNLRNFILNLNKIDTLLSSPPSIACCFQSEKNHWRAAVHRNRGLCSRVHLRPCVC